MGVPLLSRQLYKLYNIINGGRLNDYYQKIKVANENHQTFDKSQIKNYLKQWNFNPVLEENDLMGKEDVSRWSKKVDSSKIHTWTYTGGSYGEPLRLPYSKKRADIRTATARYSIEAGGYKLGEPFMMIRSNNKPAIIKFLRNETIFNPHDISEKKIAELYNLIEKKGIEFIIGFPTVIYELALYLDKYPELKKEISIRSIMSISEPIDMLKRKYIKEIFRCNFIDSYRNEEVGLIAQQDEFGGDYYVNKFGVYVEVVDPETLEPVEEGQSGKVVVTDICNDLVPIVRYDTGDFAIASKYQDGELLSISNLVGREAERIYTVEGNPITSLTLSKFIYKPLAKTGKVYPFQMAQKNRGMYELRIKAKQGDIPDKTYDQILRGLKSVLGESSHISMKLVDDIQPQPSGKRPIFKNEMS